MSGAKHEDLVSVQDVLRLVREYIGKTGNLESKKLLGQLVRAVQEDIKVKRVI